MVKYQDRYWIETNAEWTTVQKPDIQEKIKLNETASIFVQKKIVVLCYINFGNVPKVYVTKHNDLCNFVAFFVRFRP